MSRLGLLVLLTAAVSLAQTAAEWKPLSHMLMNGFFFIQGLAMSDLRKLAHGISEGLQRWPA